ncbi:purine nucleoside phosphorylase [Scenedesmus sp. PABB004]|nr:purine nucleoside phosphorylase [Scenedesmus sp. PABB004]
MSAAVALMGLGGLLRQAIKLIRGVQITQDEASFSMAVFSVLSWFKVSERYALDGSPSRCRRRDFRRGGHRGTASAPSPNTLVLSLEWGPPYGGVGTDTFTLPAPDTLHIDSAITVGGETVSYRSVYHRKNGGRHRFRCSLSLAPIVVAMLDLLFVGAGPHALAALTRLLEPAPDPEPDAATRKTTPKAAVLRHWSRQRGSAEHRAATAAVLARVAVVDPAGAWLGRWRTQFAGLGIAHLRSSSAVHPDPLDTHALATYAAEQRRLAELRPLTEVAKSADFAGPFHVPGSALFEAFCADLVRRYCLDDCVIADQVVSLTPVHAAPQRPGGTAAAAAPPPVQHWLVGLASGRQLVARKVVLAVGSTNRARVPPALSHLQALPPPAPPAGVAGKAAAGTGGRDDGGDGSVDGACGARDDSSECGSVVSTPSDSSGWASNSLGGSPSSSACGCDACAADEPPPGTFPHGRMMHAWELAEAAAAAGARGPGGSTRGAAAALQRAGLLLPGERVVIVGGGLTSAHLAAIAAAPGGGPPSATLLMRGAWRVKQFDVDLPWMGRVRAQKLAGFAQVKSFDARAAVMRAALQGGSTPPEAAAELCALQAAGRLAVREHAGVAGAEWDWSAGRWDVLLEDGDVLHAERLWLATGSAVDARAEPLLAGLLARLPVPVVAGLPAVQPSLEWRAGAGLYVLGAYAALQLGPGALNLAGAKTGSVRLARALRSALPALAPPGRGPAPAPGADNRSDGGGDNRDSGDGGDGGGALRPCTALGGAAAPLRVAGGAGARGAGAGLAASDACCGACWKAAAAAPRARWGGAHARERGHAGMQQQALRAPRARPAPRRCQGAAGATTSAVRPSTRARRRALPCVATLNTTVKQLKKIIDPQPQSSDFADANFPCDAEGRTLHLGCKRGEVANRILSVGSMDRALLVADQLQGGAPGAPLFQHLSGRGFLTITGLYEGTPVSIITTMMGMPNMDFVVREARAVVAGQMAVVRLGTCGALAPPAALGSLVVASPGAVCIRRDPDAWTLGDGRPAYAVSAPVAADPQLAALLVAAATERVGPAAVVAGLNATADSFYSSQARLGAHFDDKNDAVITQLRERYPDAVSLEMETFHLLDLARCSRGAVRAAAFCIAAAERYSNRFITKELAAQRERQGGAAALAALVRCPLAGAVGADGRASDGGGNGGGGGHVPPEQYVWVAGGRAAATA